MIEIQDIQPLTDFQRNAKQHIRHLEKTGRPGVLTVNGRAKLVVQDVKSYRAMAARLDTLNQREAIRQGLEDVKAGKVQPLAEFFAEFRASRGLDKLAKKRPKK